MSKMIQQMSEMLKNNDIPDNIKAIMNNLSSQSEANNCSDKKDTSYKDVNLSEKESYKENTEYSNEKSSNESSNDSFDISNIDLNTMLKMKSIIDSMNKQQNDPRANLLKSLKPYLKPSRKEKVDQYIKLFSIGKAFEVLNPLGGEKKNDV